MGAGSCSRRLREKSWFLDNGWPRRRTRKKYRNRKNENQFNGVYSNSGGGGGGTSSSHVNWRRTEVERCRRKMVWLIRWACARTHIHTHTHTVAGTTNRTRLSCAARKRNRDLSYSRARTHASHTHTHTLTSARAAAGGAITFLHENRLINVKYKITSRTALN